tara:strand:- start:603 stop:917 length:315 start_codon:yes stop_codon:yes gene_type:complete
MTKWHGGKGSRDRTKDYDKYNENYERIFGKKKDNGEDEMPTKLKKSVKTYNRQTGKTTTEHFYLHATKQSELERIANDPNANPKLRIKCKKELTKRKKNAKIIK